MKIGLMFFSPFFYPLLAFSDIDIDGSKVNIEVVPEVKKEFKLDPVEFGGAIDVPVALNLSDVANVEKITQKKIKPTIEKKEPLNMPQTTIAEHLSKADKERPTAQDLTFDYNLIYNSRETKEEIVKEIDEPKVEEVVGIKEEPKLEEKIEQEVIEEVDETPIVPVVHEIVLEEAAPIDINNAGPVPINKRYENQQAANRRQKELQREREKQQEEEVKVEIEPVPILENGPINIDSSLSGLMASAPDFNIPVKVPTPEKPKEEIIEVKKENIPTTAVQEIVSMNIVEPSQLPVGVVKVEEEPPKEENNEEVVEPQKTNDFVVEQNSSSLLRPAVTQNQNSVLVDKACPQCSAKMKRDCPVCIICGYKF